MESLTMILNRIISYLIRLYGQNNATAGQLPPQTTREYSNNGTLSDVRCIPVSHLHGRPVNLP